MNGLSFQFGKMTLLVLFLSKYEENGLPSLIRKAFRNLNLILSVLQDKASHPNPLLIEVRIC